MSGEWREMRGEGRGKLASAARVAEHRSRKAACVGSSPTAGSHALRCSSKVEHPAEDGRVLVQFQPPEFKKGDRRQEKEGRGQDRAF